MTDFKKFKNDILSLPGIWKNENDIFFTQYRDCYEALYNPNYPNGSTKDIIIRTTDKTGAYLRGNYELIIYQNGKYNAIYFSDFEELKKYIWGS